MRWNLDLPSFLSSPCPGRSHQSLACTCSHLNQGWYWVFGSGFHRENVYIKEILTSILIIVIGSQEMRLGTCGHLYDRKSDLIYTDSVWLCFEFDDIDEHSPSLASAQQESPEKLRFFANLEITLWCSVCPIQGVFKLSPAQNLNENRLTARRHSNSVCQKPTLFLVVKMGREG